MNERFFMTKNPCEEPNLTYYCAICNSALYSGNTLYLESNNFKVIGCENCICEEIII